jgi:hypothetical protein
MPQTPSTIRIRGAHENNLKNIDLDLPHRQFIAVTGVSGSKHSESGAPNPPAAGLHFDFSSAKGPSAEINNPGGLVRRM